MTTELIQWLLESDEPWTRYRTLVDLLDRPEEDADVRVARKAMLAHPQVKTLMAEAAAWGEHPVTRHNDAGHALYKLSTLADFGVKASDRGIKSLLKGVMAHQSPEGAFQSVVNVSTSFGGTGEDTWAWMSCDAPTLLYSLIAMGLGSDPHVKRAVNHLVGLVDENGWRCVVAPELGKFRGPGRKADPCPIANVYALKALAQVPELARLPRHADGDRDAVGTLAAPKDNQVLHVRRRHGLSQAQISLCLVRHPARGRCAQPLSFRPRRPPFSTDAQDDHGPG